MHTILRNPFIRIGIGMATAYAGFFLLILWVWVVMGNAPFNWDFALRMPLVMAVPSGWMFGFILQTILEGYIRKKAEVTEQMIERASRAYIDAATTDGNTSIRSTNEREAHARWMGKALETALKGTGRWP